MTGIVRMTRMIPNLKNENYNIESPNVANCPVGGHLKGEEPGGLGSSEKPGKYHSSYVYENFTFETIMINGIILQFLIHFSYIEACCHP
jgi:hypothetical protein